MKQVDTTNARVIRVANKSVLFQLADGTKAYATRRVANEVLAGAELVFLVEKRSLGDHYGSTFNWLATPSAF